MFLGQMNPEIVYIQCTMPISGTFLLDPKMLVKLEVICQGNKLVPSNFTSRFLAWSPIIK